MQWTFDLNDGRWTTTVYPDVPTAIKPDTDGTLDFLSGLKLYKVSTAGLNQFAGANFTALWEGNNIQLLKESEGFGYEGLLRGIILEYESDLPITVFLYLNDSVTASPVAGTIMSPLYKRVALQVPLGSVCQYFHLGFSVTTTGASQTWMIKSVEAYFDKIQRGGDVMAQ